jgi:hypothetical protein
MVNKPETKMNWRGLRKHLFLEQAEGYVNTLEKSTFRPSTSREVFEHHDKADGQRLKPC